jgi:hypothetical protein
VNYITELATLPKIEQRFTGQESAVSAAVTNDSNRAFLALFIE